MEISVIQGNAVKSIDVDRLEERSEVAAVHFDLSACAAPDNVKMMDDNVKMVDEERSAVDVDADRSKDAVRIKDFFGLVSVRSS